MTDVFISYSRVDRETAEWLRTELVARELAVWLDTLDIPKAVEWRPEIQRAIESADAIVFLMSEASVRSVECERELDHAEQCHKRLIPIVVNGIEPEDVPARLGRLNWISCESADNRTRAFAELLDVLATDLDWVRTHTRLLVAAAEWEAEPRRSRLLRGMDLSAAEAALAGHHDDDPKPTASQRQYVLASRHAATRTLRGGIAVALLTIVALVGLVVTSVVQAQRADSERRRAVSRALAAASATNAEEDPQLALLLAVKAYETDATADARLAVRHASVGMRLSHVLACPRCTNIEASPDGRSLVASGSGHLYAWSWRAGHVIRTVDVALPPRYDSPFDLAMAPDGRHVALAADGLVVYDLAIPHAAPVVFPDDAGAPDVRSVAFGPDSQTIGVYGLDSVAAVYDLKSPNAAPRVIAQQEPYPGQFTATAISPDGALLAESGHSGTWVWDLADASVVVHENTFASDLAFSPDGSQLATGSSSGAISIRSMAHPLAAPMVIEAGGFIQSLAYTPDGNHLAAALDNQIISVWNLGAPSHRRVDLKGSGDVVWDTAFMSHGAMLASVSKDELRLWNWRNPAIFPRASTVMSGEASRLTFWGSSTVLAEGYRDTRTDAVEVASSEPTTSPASWSWAFHETRKPSLLSVPTLAHDQPVFPPKFQYIDPRHTAELVDGRLLLRDDRTVHSRIALPRMDIRSATFHKGLVALDAVASSTSTTSSTLTKPVRHMIVTGSWKSGRFRPTVLPGRLDDVDDVRWSGDGSHLAVSSGNPKGVLVWTVSDPSRAPVRMSAGGAGPIALDWKGQVLATVSQASASALSNRIDLRSVAQPKAPPLRIDGGGSVADLAFSPQGALAAATDGLLTIWTRDPQPERLTITRLPNFEYFSAVAFDSSGTRVAASSTLVRVQNDDGLLTFHVIDCEGCRPIAKLVSEAWTHLRDIYSSTEQSRLLRPYL